jgi:hypothetical protein
MLSVATLVVGLGIEPSLSTTHPLGRRASGLFGGTYDESSLSSNRANRKGPVVHAKCMDCGPAAVTASALLRANVTLPS